MDGSTVEEDLERLEERLDAVVEALDEDDLQTAQAEARNISGIIDCPLCENLENGILGGVMYAAGLTRHGRDRRTEQVKAEVEFFLETELPAARKQLRNLAGESEAVEQ